MVPFFSTPLYTGPVAAKLGGADISLFIGLPVAAGLYYLFARTIDVQAEQRLAAAEAAKLEELAAHHRRPAEGGS